MRLPDGEQADSTADDYSERVLRNEGRLLGLERLVAETRESDRKLIEQRSDSLAQELERRAESLVKLAEDQREADNREHRDALADYKVYNEHAAGLLREIYETLINENYKQSREAIDALEQRRGAATDRLEQMVRQWRDSDREALQLFAGELKEHLIRLNHAHEIQQEFQSKAVTRELWQAEKDAQLARESVMRDSIIALDRNLLAMNPIAQADKAHTDILERMERSVTAAAQILDNKIDVVADKVAAQRETADKQVAYLKETQDRQQGRSSGYSNLYGWGVAAVAALTSVVVVVNVVTGR